MDASTENVHIGISSLLSAVQAILPLSLLLIFVQFIFIRTKIKHLNEILFGIFLTLVGMAIFNFGLFAGLIPLGNQVGNIVPATFSTIQIGNPLTPHGALFDTVVGKLISILFAFFLGYGATLAEPALAALGVQVETITNGAFRKKLLIQSVAVGVGTGIAMGIAKLVFELDFVWLLLVPYAVLLIITLVSKENITNIGWDAAGVTTGPITVPLVIALGLGIGNSVSAVDGFGILSLASVYPILSVLILGLIVQKREA
jgi:hypothetical protein